jgi:two-component system response regulator QseB
LKILLVEDDPLLASGLLTALRRASYTVEHVNDGPAAIGALSHTPFDLVVLDLGLPTLDGTEVLRALRSSDNPVPVLVLSARDSTRDRVQGLDLGADDYLVKPFELDELLAALSLNPENLSATWQGRPVELQRLEFMLLLQLAENPQRIFNRAQLEESLYGWGEGAESNTIDVHVHHLRRKLGPAVIKTIRGVGYRLGDLAA